MFASIACAAMLLLAPASTKASPPVFIGIEAIARDTLVDLERLSVIFAHQAKCDLCQYVRSAPSSEFGAAPHPNGGPSRIILMRHADKPDDPDDPDLSAAGVARAERLATYIPQTFGKPDYIMATAQSKHSDRPLETVEPLAKAVGVTVQDDIRDKDFEDLVEEIFSDPAYHGKTVLICWHHGTLPAIAALLGATPDSYPDPWPDDTYNVILDFRYDPNSGNAPSVTRVTEPF
jgi:broad specificity phosphatase PhoE